MMNSLLALLSIVLLLDVSWRLAAWLKPKDAAEALLYGGTAAFAQIVLIAETLNLVSGVNRLFFWIITQSVLAIAIRLFGKQEPVRFRIFPVFSDWSLWQKITLAGVTAAFLLNLILILTVPQSNPDALSTHLPRIGHWLYSGSLNPWPMPPVRIWQVIYPIDAQLAILWTVLLSGSDRFAGLVQFLAVLMTVLAIYKTARLLGFSSHAARWSGLLFSAFTLVQLQASTVQTDMVVMAGFMLGTFFSLQAIFEEKPEVWWAAAAALGLGIGTKQTFFFLLPTWGLLVVVSQYRKNRRIWPGWRPVAILSIGILLLGSGAYWRNWQAFGNPLGPAEILREATGELDGKALALKVPVNMVRFAYQMLDPSGLPRPLHGYAHKVRWRIFAALLSGAPIEGDQFTFKDHVFRFATVPVPEESSAWYGPVSVLFLYPAMLWAFFEKRKRGAVPLWLLPVGFLLFWVIDILARPGWDPFQGRYFAGVIALNAPLMGIWFQNQTARARLLEIVATVLSLLVLFATLAYNPAKPLLGKWADDIGIWQKDRIFLQTVQYKADRELFYHIEKTVPEKSRLGLYAPVYMLTYPLYGEGFSRQVTEIWPESALQEPDLASRFDYLLLHRPSLPAESPQPCRQTIFQTETWSLLQCP
jgi:4-amino-4-deoxy-L-arabinose transferase-like glycosyltransferase